jgi:hypothetical protein
MHFFYDERSTLVGYVPIEIRRVVEIHATNTPQGLSFFKVDSAIYSAHRILNDVALALVPQ